MAVSERLLACYSKFLLAVLHTVLPSSCSGRSRTSGRQDEDRNGTRPHVINYIYLTAQRFGGRLVGRCSMSVSLRARRSRFPRTADRGVVWKRKEGRRHKGYIRPLTGNSNGC